VPGVPLSALAPEAGIRPLFLQTQVFDSLSGQPLDGATVLVTQVQKDLRWTTFTGADGQQRQVLESGVRYTDSASKAGYTTAGTSVSTVGVQGPDTLNARLYLQKSPRAGDVFVLRNLYYDFNRSDIRPDAAKVLDNLIQYLNEYPTVAIDLSSHTDSRGGDAYNMALSRRRAEAARRYLLDHGVAPERVTVHGFGETRLVNGCSNGVHCSEVQHQANRRTEVKVLHP
jgi:outer membrane protein OmpA-like peptidoglycan-associated protein